MAQLDIFLLGHRPQGHDVVKPARSRNVSDLAISFTADLAQFMFDFAEQYIQCEVGDEILLLRGQIDCQGIISRPDFIDHFRTRVQNGHHFELQDTLQRREAICRRSEVFKHRRRTDLMQQPGVLPSSHPQLGCMR
ncbi:hypothetical protein [Marinobacterium sp. MBR-109]|jgi:hypothetical protein|uniref:hypothetical protein n=1 Tax=Marinobacterium sp. MBR-109 TaxID=3156462 RepID=UPI00339175E2